jgi:hypothetical protein
MCVTTFGRFLFCGCGSLNTALFNPPKKNPEQGSGLSSLGRIIRTHKVCVVVVVVCVPLFLPKTKSAKFSRGAAPPDAPSTAHGARSDGAATKSLLRRICADHLRRAHSARRVELMLLRRS